ncbi:MAG TPA: DUF6691 family protein [Xanthobacteraceae bacterium]|nr:DUF6691 family protein [Xanthobacteraceae bacterium]
MPVIIAALVCGLVFGSGLQISGMTNTLKIQNFLDLFGTWDPSLAVTMAAALAFAAPGLWYARRRGRPLVAARITWPSKNTIDPPLWIGSAIFGVGWGLVGLCPGPAIENLVTRSPQIAVFVIAMATGATAIDAWRMRAQRRITEATSTT